MFLLNHTKNKEMEMENRWKEENSKIEDRRKTKNV